jgi:hypothetical protein
VDKCFVEASLCQEQAEVCFYHWTNQCLVLLRKLEAEVLDNFCVVIRSVDDEIFSFFLPDLTEVSISE